MLTRYLRYCSRRSSGIGRSSRTARILNSSPEPNDSLPSEEKEAMRPSTASSGVSNCTRRNCPCIGMFWNSFRYGNTRSAWNSMPPCWKPRKMPTTCSLGKSWICAMLFPPSSVPALRRVGVLKLECVQGLRVATETRSHSLVDEVLQDVEIEIDQGRVFVCLLQATRIVRHREAVDRVGEHGAEDDLSLADLRNKDIHRPHGIAAMRAELHEEHLAADEL